jgi:hypothetical protein
MRTLFLICALSLPVTAVAAGPKPNPTDYPSDDPGVKPVPIVIPKPGTQAASGGAAELNKQLAADTTTTDNTTSEDNRLPTEKDIADAAWAAAKVEADARGKRLAWLMNPTAAYTHVGFVAFLQNYFGVSGGAAPMTTAFGGGVHLNPIGSWDVQAFQFVGRVGGQWTAPTDTVKARLSPLWEVGITLQVAMAALEVGYAGWNVSNLRTESPAMGPSVVSDVTDAVHGGFISTRLSIRGVGAVAGCRMGSEARYAAPTDKNASSTRDSQFVAYCGLGLTALVF